jgi:uncharacterized protein YprB with RNaseH-like and TPR domain
MPDFAKALKPLRAATKSFSLAQQLQFLRNEWSRQAPAIDAELPGLLPPGDIESTALGSHYRVQGIYPHDYFHGKVLLGRFSSNDLECLMQLMREKASTPHRDRIIFLDTETTGAQGGAGTCPFLVGVGYFAGDDFHMLQYFIRDFDEEPSMLCALGDLLGRFELVVTYNGASFDLPLLENRFTLARLDSPFHSMSHFDLLFTTRRLWKNGHGSCRLTALEREMISFFRGRDVPGSMIPRTYFEYLRHRQTGALPGVFTHNVHDVISLAALTVHACDRVILEPAPLDDPLDLYSLGRVVERSGDWHRSMRLYEMAIAGGLPDTFREKAAKRVKWISHKGAQSLLCFLCLFVAILCHPVIGLFVNSSTT